MEGKVVVITGAGGGIGEAAAKAFLKAGAIVYGWDLRFREDAINGFSAMAVDIRQPEEVQQAVRKILSAEGKIDVLINNAGITRDARLEKMTMEQWQEVIDVNLTGVFNCTKAIAPHMIERKSGNIINTSSVVAHYGNYGQSNYVASKSGVIGLTKVWARELGKHSIRVNAVAPGFIATDMIATVPEKVLDQMLQQSALKSMGTPEDIANAYLFLASDAARFITAHTLQVDGGLVI
jgi:3-oxoacyl-[acyl-carrier protein] reductase